ncbi:MAG: bis(5'-nucleosyl)-tetraphosphatase (symmetrical) YqeK [Candidatus Howiella sp.]
MTDAEYKRLLKARLKPERYAHSLAVAAQAVHLAEKYGADREKAYLAGLLHDICKNDSAESLLQTMDRFGILLSNLEKSAPKLWHAMAGAALLQGELGIADREVLDAVRYHTTARAGMSLLEKIIYLADYTSADRDYPGAKDMRRTVDRSLEAGMEIALIFTITDLAEEHRAIHPDTVEAYNQQMLERRKP